MTRPLLLPLLALAALIPGAAASAETPEPSDTAQVRRLSPEQKEQFLAENERRRAEAAELDTALGGAITRPSGIHGEIGAEIGTGGTRGFFSSALVPPRRSRSSGIFVRELPDSHARSRPAGSILHPPADRPQIKKRGP